MIQEIQSMTSSGILTLSEINLKVLMEKYELQAKWESSQTNLKIKETLMNQTISELQQ